MKILLILIPLFFFSLPVSALEVVVNPEVPRSTISKSTLRAIFGMRIRSWRDSTNIQVFILSNSTVHEEFVKNNLGMFPYQLQRSVDRLVFSGTGQSPIKVRSMEEMQKKVLDTPGAIGYISSNFIDGLKILVVR